MCTIQSRIVLGTVFPLYDDRRISILHQLEVEEQPCRPAVPVGEGMDLYEFNMKVGGSF